MIDSTWDCHAHVIGPGERFPLWEGREYDPPLATLEAYLALLDRHGLTHGVLVQPSVYGFDNRCMLDALDRAGGRLRGVAVPDPAAAPGDLERLHERGVRGVRCNVLNAGGLAPDVVRRWAPVMRALGWHVELHLEVERVADLHAFVQAFGVPVVIDHMGRPRLDAAGAAAPSFGRLVEAVRDGACFVKLSAPYRFSNEPSPWADVTPLARALLEADPARCMWGSDRPHVFTEPPVDPVDAFGTLDAWCPDPALRRRVLSDTPQTLFAGA